MVARLPTSTLSQERIEEFAQDSARRIGLLWELRFGYKLVPADLEGLATVIWECLWEKPDVRLALEET